MPHNFHPPKLTKPNIRHSSVSINVAAYLLHCAKGILQSDRNNVYTCTVARRRAQGSFKLLQLINCLVFQSNIFRWLIQTRQAIVSDSFEHLIEIESWARQIINWTTTQRCPRTRKITLNLGKLIITSGNGRVFSQETSPRVIATHKNINSHWHQVYRSWPETRLGCTRKNFKMYFSI